MHASIKAHNKIRNKWQPRSFLYFCTNFFLNLKKNSKTTRFYWLIIPSIAGLVSIGTFFLAKKPEYTEQVYSRGVYPVLASVLSCISNLFPVSLNDLFYFILLALPWFLFPFVILKRITLKSTGKIVLNVVASVYVVFYLFWGFNYFRQDVNMRLELSDYPTDSLNFYRVFDKLVYSANKGALNYTELPAKSVDSLLEISYKKLAPVFHISYPMGKRNDKKITLSGFFAKAGISGYFGPFFNEVHVNKKVHALEYPFVLAHEKAHQLGITSEAEANFYAWLVCTQTSSEFIQYSANLALLNHFLIQGRSFSGFSERTKQLYQCVKTDLTNIWEHWKNLRNEKIDKAAGKANDAYLKANKIEKGIDDYHGVVKHVMDFSLDTAFQQRHSIDPF